MMTGIEIVDQMLEGQPKAWAFPVTLTLIYRRRACSFSSG